MTREKIEKLKKACDKATKGPWWVEGAGLYYVTDEKGHPIKYLDRDHAQFIALSRTALPVALRALGEIWDLRGKPTMTGDGRRVDVREIRAIIAKHLEGVGDE